MGEEEQEVMFYHVEKLNEFRVKQKYAKSHHT